MRVLRALRADSGVPRQLLAGDAFGRRPPGHRRDLGLQDTLDRKKAGGSPIAEPIDGVTMTSRSAANVFKAVPDSDSDDGER